MKYDRESLAPFLKKLSDKEIDFCAKLDGFYWNKFLKKEHPEVGCSCGHSSEHDSNCEIDLFMGEFNAYLAKHFKEIKNLYEEIVENK